MTVNDKGNIGLTKVMSDLTEKGYSVFLPIADTSCVDLIAADEGMNIKKIQIKYRKVNKFGVICVQTRSVVNGKSIPIPLEQIDLWAIYCPDTKQIYYLSSDILKGKSVLSLRVDKEVRKCEQTTFADQFTDIKKVW